MLPAETTVLSCPEGNTTPPGDNVVSPGDNWHNFARSRERFCSNLRPERDCRDVFQQCLRYFGNALTGFLCCTSDTTFDINPRCWATKHKNKTSADRQETQNQFHVAQATKHTRQSHDRFPRESSQKWIGSAPVFWVQEDPTQTLLLPATVPHDNTCFEAFYSWQSFVFGTYWNPTQMNPQFQERTNKRMTPAMTACCSHQRLNNMFAVWIACIESWELVNRCVYIESKDRPDLINGIAWRHLVAH